jgi:hypothetical protein
MIRDLLWVHHDQVNHWGAHDQVAYHTAWLVVCRRGGCFSRPDDHHQHDLDALAEN